MKPYKTNYTTEQPVSAATLNRSPLNEQRTLAQLGYAGARPDATLLGWQSIDATCLLRQLDDAGFEASPYGYLGIPRLGINANLLGQTGRGGELAKVALVVGGPGSVAPDGRGPSEMPWLAHAENWIEVPPRHLELANALVAALQQTFPQTEIFAVGFRRTGFGAEVLDLSVQAANETVLGQTSVQRLSRWFKALIPSAPAAEPIAISPGSTYLNAAYAQATAFCPN